MRTIWKYPIPEMAAFELLLPPGAIIRYVDAQGEWAQMWVEVDVPEQDPPDPVRRQFIHVGTGHSIPRDQSPFQVLTYVGSYQLPTPGPLVGHVYEIEGVRADGAG